MKEAGTLFCIQNMIACITWKEKRFYTKYVWRVNLEVNKLYTSLIFLFYLNEKCKFYINNFHVMEELGTDDRVPHESLL